MNLVTGRDERVELWLRVTLPQPSWAPGEDWDGGMAKGPGKAEWQIYEEEVRGLRCLSPESYQPARGQDARLQPLREAAGLSEVLGLRGQSPGQHAGSLARGPGG